MDATPGDTPLRDGRYERKFVVEALTPRQVEMQVRLHPGLFCAPYPPRYVNNIYLDTPDMIHYQDNIYGAARRRKVRVRWYGELLGEVARPGLEIKVKEGLVGTKLRYRLPGFCLEAGFGDRALQRLFAGADLPPVVGCELRALNLVLLNRYYRRYYASRDGRFRITVDRELTYCRSSWGLGPGPLHRQTSPRQVIVELKYGVAQEPGAGRVASFFPFRLARFSKYVQGVERVCS